MKTTKLTRTLLTGMMTCTMALTAMSVSTFVSPSVTQTVLADAKSSTFKLNLHKKKVYDMLQIENTGATDAEYDKLAGLNGVKFTAYNITALFYEVKAANPDKTNREITNLMSRDWAKTYKAQAEELSTVETTTDDAGKDGIASFNLPKKTVVDGNSLHSVFMFEELDTEVPDDATEAFLKSQPFAMGMNDNLAKNSTVDLYAKNHGVQKDLVDDKGVPVSEDYVSFTVGEHFDYISTSPVPFGIEDPDNGYTSIRFLDQMTKGGTEFVKLKGIYAMINGEEVDLLSRFNDVGNPIDSTKTPEKWSGAGYANAGFQFTLDFSQEALDKLTPTQKEALMNLVKDISGKQLRFEYTMKITEEAVPYVNIGNKFYGYFTHNDKVETTIDDAQPVETGGVKIKKQDRITEEGLKGAEFIIKQQTPEGLFYAKLLDRNNQVVSSTDGDYFPYEIKWVKDEDDATRVESAEKGHLMVQGLKAGDYILQETAAPTGYTWTMADTPFSVDEASVTEQILKLNTVNNDHNPDILPITGGIGIVTFLAVGALAMGGALVYKKKQA